MRKYNRLYHISFNVALSGILKPQVPAGYDGGEGINAEPNLPRICMGLTVEGCVRAIYKNIENLFTVKGYPHVDLHIYVAKVGNRNDIVTPEVLTGLGFVHDAHITEEHWLVNPIRVRRSGDIVRVHNPGNYTPEKYRPFDDKKYYLTDYGPSLKDLKIEIL